MKITYDKNKINKEILTSEKNIYRLHTDRRHKYMRVEFSTNNDNLDIKFKD